jgi:hypothetical protein
MDLTPMDYVRAALANAMIEGMTAEDLFFMAMHAQTARDFDDAVNMLANTMPCYDDTESVG